MELWVKAAQIVWAQLGQQIMDESGCLTKVLILQKSLLQLLLARAPSEGSGYSRTPPLIQHLLQTLGLASAGMRGFKHQCLDLPLEETIIENCS